MDSLFDRLQNPEHTGERRCWPCTVVNVALLLLGCAAVARRRSRSLAAALGVGGAAAIALRGYLVPATPRFAPRLVSLLPGDPFHDEFGREAFHAKSDREAPRAESHREASRAEADRFPPETADESGSNAGPAAHGGSGSLGDTADEETGERVLAALVESGVVVADEETVALDGDFRDAWRAEMRDLRNRDDEGLARALRSVAPDETVVEVVEQGGGLASGGLLGDPKTWLVVSDGSGDPANERWLTRPVAVAETAGVRVLAEETDLDSALRAQAAGPLRTFLESCPVCDGPVVETTVVECCGGPGGARADAPDEVLACTDCDERLYTFR